MKMRVCGQAISESMVAMLATVLVITCVVGAFALVHTGRANAEPDMKQVFASARELAHAGGVTLTIAQGTDSTSVLTCSGIVGAACTASSAEVPAQTITGAVSFSSRTAGTWTTITFFVYPDGMAQIYGYGACPSDLTLLVAGTSSYGVSCDPIGA